MEVGEVHIEFSRVDALPALAGRSRACIRVDYTGSSHA